MVGLDELMTPVAFAPDPGGAGVRLGCFAAYANPDRVAGKAAAEKLITTAHTCPVREINRLGRTLTVCRTEFLTGSTTPACPTVRPNT